MVARADAGDGQAEALVEERESGGYHPVVPTAAEEDLQNHFIHYADRQFDIANDPGARTLRYSATNQNIFGVWSQWQTSQATVVQPPAVAPQILAASLAVTAPTTGTACPAELTVELIWDWSDRSPDQISLIGRMFATPDRSTDVPVAIPPAGLARDLGGGGAAVSLNFSGDTVLLAGAPPGATITYLDEQGENAVTAGAAQGSGPRRYRLVIPDLTVDFAATDHVGHAIWAQGTELIAPQRSAISAHPFQTYASTPIAQAVPAELVPLSSLPDAEGSSHARISWAAAPGAESYVVYGSDESTMRSHYGLGEPALDETLSERVTELLDAWEADPDRRPFTRLTPRPVYDTSIDIALPRGMTGISTFVIVSTSAGQVQGPWPVPGPTLRDDLILRATPRVARPATPEIEAIADGDDVRLTVRTRPGHRVGRVDIHRVRVGDAARDLDTMGPPITTVSVGSPGWTSELDDDDTPLVFTGTDNPGTSWRRVWYRAVAWADDEWPVDGEPFPYQIAERGLLPGRSASSNAVSVAVPPPGPPDLSDLEISWPGGSVADVLLSWTTSVPFAAPLGVHRTEIDVRADGQPTPLIAYAGPLAGIGTTEPLSGDGVWRVDGSNPAQFQALVRRADVAIELDATVTVIDPLGRSQQRVVHVDAGSVLPAPDLGDLDVFSISGRGTMLTFTSAAPIVELGGQAYRLTVVVHPEASRTPTIPPVIGPPVLIPPGGRQPARPSGGRNPGRLPGRPGSIRPGRLTPVASEPTLVTDDPTAVLDLTVTPTIELPDGFDLTDVFGPRPRPITVKIDLPDIPLDRNQSATREAVQIRRQRGAGPVRSYSVFAPFAVDHFELTLRSPDGRVAQATTEDRR